MTTRDDILQAIVAADKAGDSDSVRKLGAYLKSSTPATPSPPEMSTADKIGSSIRDTAAGLVRGAGSIGATLLAPVDMAKDALAGKGLSLESNRQRRKDIDEALGEMGADTNSLSYGAGKLGGEIAGTAGAGGLVARGAAAIPGVASKAPNLIQAIRTSGMTGGNAVTRAAGGAAAGAVSAGLVNPEDAATGAVIGGALPGVVQIAGKIGQKAGAVVRGPEQSNEIQQAIAKARDAGYVIPPSQANPNLMNRALEGVAGKVTTAQNASAKNAAVTSKLAAQELGLAADTKLTPDLLQTVRKQAGQAYAAIDNAGTITPGQAYNDALDKIVAPHLKAAQGFPDAKASPVIDLVDSLRSPSFDASSAVAKIGELRAAADDAFRSGSKDVARASKAAAGALEDAIESHLAKSGNEALLQDFQGARQLIAKTYSVEKAMNPSTGAIDARKLAAQLAKGKPLSGGLKDAAEFAGRFPKANQTVEGMGSLPGTSPLDWHAMGATSLATGNPLMMLGVAGRPAARAAVLSPVVQDRLIQQNAISRLADPRLRQFGYRVAPQLGDDR